MLVDAETLLCKTLNNDDRTRNHCRRVSEYARLICGEIGLSKDECVRITTAALLHDIGKSTISLSLLRKPDKLSKEEYERIKKHPEQGVELLNKYTEFNDVTTDVLHHHERLDGRGYPHGLTGNHIPFGAKIIAIADSFDAMTSHREYCQAKSKDEALRELELHAGTQFDRDIAFLFIKMVKVMVDKHGVIAAAGY